MDISSHRVCNTYIRLLHPFTVFTATYVILCRDNIMRHAKADTSLSTYTRYKKNFEFEKGSRDRNKK